MFSGRILKLVFGEGSDQLGQLCVLTYLALVKAVLNQFERGTLQTTTTSGSGLTLAGSVRAHPFCGISFVYDTLLQGYVTRIKEQVETRLNHY